MEKIGYIEIRISGSKGYLDLNPDTYDIREIISILENAEHLLYPEGFKDRPIISYKIEEGSVRHILKTSIQSIIGFNAVIGQVAENKSIDFLDLKTAQAFENIQNTAFKNNYVLSIKTSLPNSNELKVDSSTNFYRTDSIWVEAEFYFYGKITNAGGKGKTNLHILTDEGSFIIQTPLSFFENLEENIIHKKTYGVRAIGKQHSETGEVDSSTLKFVELIEYKTNYDEHYLKGLREKAKKTWLSNINPDNWLKEIRGGYVT